MKVKQLIVAAVAVLALASSSLAAAADAPRLQIGPSIVKAKNGKLVLVASCVGDAACRSVLTARIDVKNGGLGAALFAAAGFLLLLAVIMLSVAVAYFIHMTGLDLAWCFLIVWGGYTVLALLRAFIGFRRVKLVRVQINCRVEERRAQLGQVVG